MTSAPADLVAFRTGTVIPLTGLSGNDVGIAPDASHLSSGGYHVGCEDIQSIGKWNTDYSTRQARDRLDGTNLASAMDIGDDWPKGGRAAWLRFNNLLAAQLRANDPALAALRAVNFSPDGSATKRYDSFNPAQGVVDSTDSVYMHTHLEFWRNTAGTPARAAALARVGQIIDAAIRNVPLGGTVSDFDPFGKPPNNPREVGVYAADLSGQEWSECSPYDGKTQSARTKRLIRIETKLDATLQALGVAQADLDELQARPALQLTDEQAAGIADRIATALAAHPDTPLGDADKPAIVEAVKTALREGLGQ